METPTRWKQVPQNLRMLGNAAKLGWKLAGGKVQIVDSSGAFLHHIELTQEEHNFLKNGGKIVLIHACGREAHVKLP